MTGQSKITKYRLTDDTVRMLAVPGSEERRFWDVDLPGFCLRVQRTGSSSFCIKHNWQGKPRWQTLGVPGPEFNTAHAREAAAVTIQTVQEARLATPPKGRPAKIQSGLSVKDMAELYLLEGPLAKLDKRASSWEADTSNLRRHIIPLIGAMAASTVKREDVARMVLNIVGGANSGVIRTCKQGYARVTGGPGVALRSLQVLAATYAWAIQRELVAVNPAKGIRLPRRPGKERFLSVNEARRLLLALDALEKEGGLDVKHAVAIRLLLLTGARKTEIVGLKWSEVDFGRRCFTLPPERSKTGGSVGSRRIHFGDEAMAQLIKLRRDGLYVFPAAKGTSGHFTCIQKAWCKTRDRAGLGAMRIHDLRHSFASFAVQNGEGIALIRDALGHTTLRMTERYLQLADGAGRDFAKRASKGIMDLAA